jgi:hypothetical protein
MDNANQPTAGGSKTGMWVALIIAVIVLGGGAYFLFARENGTNTNSANLTGNADANTNTASNLNGLSNENANSGLNANTNANTATTTADWQQYENENYGYVLKFPQSWRIAEDYMTAFATVRHPQNNDQIEDYVVLTNLTEDEESDFITYAQNFVGIASRPWYDFAAGRSIVIIPSTASKEDYEKVTPLGSDTTTQIPSDIREVTLVSGLSISRLRSYQKNDNGEFTFEIALFPVTGRDYKYLEVRIEVNQGNYESAVFDSLLNTIDVN